MIRKIVIATTTLWVINEIIQATEVLHEYKVFNFLVIHISSFYGAIIFCFLVAYLKLNKTFMIIPLAIEIFQSRLSSCNCFDYWDLLFSLIGILTVILILAKEKTNLLNTNK